MFISYEVLIIGLVLSADSFSAAIAMGNRPCTKKDALKFAFASGSSEAIFALIGSMAGAKIIEHFKAIDHWIAFFLLGGVALHMFYEGICDLRNKEIKEEQKEFHGFAKILLVSFATSLDAFGVGISLGIAQKPISPYITSIGVWAFVTTIAGLYLARIMSKKAGPIFTLIASVILGIMAFEMLKI